MIYKKSIFSRILSNGMRLEIAVVMSDGRHHAGLYLNGRAISGPLMPEPLTPPKDDMTYWMGNKPSVGLTSDEVDRIRRAVDLENSVLRHRATYGTTR